MTLSRLLFLTLLLPLTSGLAGARGGPLKVVTTVPDTKDIAEIVGGERVSVKSLTKGSENMHHIRVRPSMMVALRRADVLIQIGLSLESTWLPSLRLAVRNHKLNADQPGFINCSEGWEAIQVPKSLSRKGGDLHPQGNPHFSLDPRSGAHIAKRIASGLSEVDPDGASYYARRLEGYLELLEQKAADWKRLAEGLEGKRVACYHQEYNYLAKYLGVEVAVSIEPKPGIPPTPRDVARVVRELEERDVELILTAAWSNNRIVRDIAERSGAKVLELPAQVGGARWARSWVELIEGNLVRLRAALGLPPVEESAASPSTGEAKSQDT